MSSCVYSIGSEEGNTGGGAGGGGRFVCHSGQGYNRGSDGYLSGDEKAEVVVPTDRGVKPEKRRKKGGAPQEKGQELIEREREKSVEKEASSKSVALLMGRHRGGKRDVKEAAIKTQVGHGEEKENSEREQAETGWQPGAEDIDLSIMKEVIKVFERDKSSVASQAGGPVLPKQQQKLPMATGEEKRLKGAVAVTQSGHGEGSAAMTAQVVKGKGTDKSGAKEVEKRWSCPNVEPTESILHTDVALEAKFKISRELLEDFPTPRDQRLLSFFSEEQIEENVTLMTAQRELKESLKECLAEAERMSVQHYIKTEKFKAAMKCLNRLWYAAGFDICKLQVEDELVRAEQTRTISLDMLDWLDPKKKGKYLFPEVELVSEGLIPKPSLEKRAPLEIMKDLAEAESDLSVATPPSPEGDKAEVHEACIVCTRKHALPLCKAVVS
ncbi:hypothetical protein Dimus_010910 [Dionaea muscipula]